MIKYLWKDNRLRFVLALVGNISSAVAMVMIPRYVGNLIDTIVGNTEADIIPLVVEFLLVLLMLVASLLFYFITNYRHMMTVQMVLSKDLAAKLVTRLRKLSEVTNIFNQEALAVLNGYFYNIMYLIRTAVAFGLALYVGISISWEVIIWIMVFVSSNFLINHLFAKKLAHYAMKIQEKNVAINAAVTGVFNAIRTVNIYSAKALSLIRLNRTFEDKRKAAVNEARFQTWVGQLNNFFGYMSNYGVLIVSFILVRYGRLEIGEVIALQMLLEFLTGPMFDVMRCKNAMDATKEIRKHLKGILDEPDEEVTAALPVNSINFRNVAFSYTDEAFMSDLNLTFEHGKRYLIVGQSGCGKSTLLKMILKELMPSSGTVTFGGTDISSFNLPTWYKNIAYTGQKVEIIPGTLRENIILGKPYDETRLNSIVSLLSLGYLSDKLDKQLNEDLSNFSGGELQRIAIARMLYDDSPIFIFDEFSSALDNINAHQVERELLKIDNKLLISVTHRLHIDLLESYDKIIIMESGRIKCAGKLSELMEDLRPFLLGDEASSVL